MPFYHATKKGALRHDAAARGEPSFTRGAAAPRSSHAESDRGAAAPRSSHADLDRGAAAPRNSHPDFDRGAAAPRGNHAGSGLDLIDQEPLPLNEAATQLGLGPEELLKAFRAGDYRGFVDEGTLFIYVPEAPADEIPAEAAPIDEASIEAGPNMVDDDWREMLEPTPLDQEVQDSEAPNPEQLQAVQAQPSDQQKEIEQLRKANSELQEEKDRLFRLLEREQVLRQGIQRTLDRAWASLLPPAEAPEQPKESIQTIDRYAKEPEETPRRTEMEDEPLDIGNFLGHHD